jgi:hypothetical protein
MRLVRLKMMYDLFGMRTNAMTRRLLAGLIAVGVLSFAIAVIVGFAQGKATGVRTTTFVKGRSLESLVKPGDSEIVVIPIGDPPVRVLAAPGTSEIDWETQHADVVLRVSIQRKQSFSTANRDWIETTFTAGIQEVLKPSKKVDFQAGQDIAFTVDGGELSISAPTAPGPVRVRAQVAWAIPFEVGEQYLIFGSIPSDSQLIVTPDMAYEMTTDGYVRSLVRGRPLDEIHGAPASSVLNKVRTAAASSGAAAQ